MGSLAKRILFWMALVGLSPFLLIAFAEYRFVERTIISTEETRLHSVLASRMVQLEEWLGNVARDLRFSGQSNCVQGRCSGSCATRGSDANCPFMNAILKSHPSYRVIAAFDRDWSPVSRAGTQDTCAASQPPPELRALLETSDDFVVSPDRCLKDQETLIVVGQQIKDDDGTARAFIVAELGVSNAIAPLLSSKGLRQTETLHLVDCDGIHLCGRSKVPPPEAYRTLFSLHGDSSRPPEHIREYQGTHDAPVLGLASAVPGTGWTLVAEIDKAVAFMALDQLKGRAGLVGTLALLLVVSFSLMTSRRLSMPLQKLTAVARDVSCGKHGQRAPLFRDSEIREVGNAFNHMLDRIKANQEALARSASLAAIGELTASLGHEMLNPLSAIRLNLEGLQARLNHDANGAEMTAIALEQSNRLEHLLNGILNYGRPLHLKREDVVFQTLLHDLMFCHQNRLEKHALSVNVTDDLGSTQLLLDREQMGCAISNLVGNAINWSPAGSIIRVSASFMEVHPGWFSIQVEDQGPGIQAKHMGKLFKPFFTTRQNGNGLGLPNTKKIVEYHGGHVVAENIKGGGARFSIHLPIQGVCNDQNPDS